MVPFEPLAELPGGAKEGWLHLGQNNRRPAIAPAPLTFSYLSAGLSACQLAGLLEDHVCLPNQPAYVPVVTGLWADSGVDARPRRGRFEKPGDFERDGVTVVGERRQAVLECLVTAVVGGRPTVDCRGRGLDGR